MSVVVVVFDESHHEHVLYLVNPFSFFSHQYFNLAIDWPSVLNLLVELNPEFDTEQRCQDSKIILGLAAWNCLSTTAFSQ